MNEEVSTSRFGPETLKASIKALILEAEAAGGQGDRSVPQEYFLKGWD